jgi:hypothetical protein
MAAKVKPLSSAPDHAVGAVPLLRETITMQMAPGIFGNVACNTPRPTIHRSCISTKAGTFTNLPHCGKVVSAKVGCDRFNGKYSRAVPALIVKGGLNDTTNSDL